jgi:hypothetical protein
MERRCATRCGGDDGGGVAQRMSVLSSPARGGSSSSHNDIDILYGEEEVVCITDWLSGDHLARS